MYTSYASIWPPWVPPGVRFAVPAARGLAGAPRGRHRDPAPASLARPANRTPKPTPPRMGSDVGEDEARRPGGRQPVDSADGRPRMTHQRSRHRLAVSRPGNARARDAVSTHPVTVGRLFRLPTLPRMRSPVPSHRLLPDGRAGAGLIIWRVDVVRLLPQPRCLCDRSLEVNLRGWRSGPQDHQRNRSTAAGACHRGQRS